MRQHVCELTHHSSRPAQKNPPSSVNSALKNVPGTIELPGPFLTPLMTPTPPSELPGEGTPPHGSARSSRLASRRFRHEPHESCGLRQSEPNEHDIRLNIAVIHEPNTC